jgi:hypothetical protein
VKRGAHRVSFPDLPDDHWIGGGSSGKGPKRAVVMTGRTNQIKMAPRIECTFRCNKITSKNLTTSVLPVHFCHVYLFYEKWDEDGKKVLCEDRLTFSEDEKKRAGLADDGKCDHKLVRGATYHCYFAGKELSRQEIDALLGERSRLLIKVKAQKEIVIQQSFFWWIALLHHVETAFPDPVEVLTKVRKLYYDNAQWNHLIDRGAVPRLYDWSTDDGAITAPGPVSLPIVYALGRTYHTNPNGTFVLNRPSWYSTKDPTRQMADRHDYVLFPDGKRMMFGHVLTGIESHRFGTSIVGREMFDHPRSAATWAGDLGQAVHTAIDYGGNASAWIAACSENAGPVEILGDVHGDVLGRKGYVQPGGKPLSEVLEMYFTDPERDKLALKSFLAAHQVSRGAIEQRWNAAKSGDAGPPGADLAGLAAEISSFAEVWDSEPGRTNFNAEKHAPLVHLALTYFCGELLALDP